MTGPGVEHEKAEVIAHLLDFGDLGDRGVIGEEGVDEEAVDGIVMPGMFNELFLLVALSSSGPLLLFADGEGIGSPNLPGAAGDFIGDRKRSSALNPSFGESSFALLTDDRRSRPADSIV